MISRRTLFRRALQVAPAILLPDLILPKRKVFAVGWHPKPEPIVIEYRNEHWNSDEVEMLHFGSSGDYKSAVAQYLKLTGASQRY